MENDLRRWVRQIELMEALGAHAVREITFTARRAKAQHCIEVTKNIGDPVAVQVNASIHKIGLLNARVKMTLIGPPEPVGNIAAMLERSGLSDFVIRDPDSEPVV